MKLTKVESEVMHILFLYRGLRAKDVAALRLKTTDLTIANEKSIYNVLRRLQKKGMVTKLKKAEYDYSLYYLSERAFELLKYELNIQYGSNGNGYLPYKSDTTIWDMPYKIYSPPRYQWGHYLMVVDCIKAMLPLFEDIRLQLAYYCNLKYEHNYKPYKVKPDLMLTARGKMIAIEVDTGTESKQQLIAKFKKYKLYCDYCKKNEVIKKVDTILFVVPEGNEVNLNRRWVTMLEAFYTAFEEQLNTPINLIFIPINDVENTVKFELEKPNLEIKYKNYINNHFSGQGYTESFYYQATPETNPTKVYLNKDAMTFMPGYILLHQVREAYFFRDKYSLRLTQDRLKDVPFPTDKHNGYKYNFIMRVFLCQDGQPAIPKGLEKSGLSKAFINKLMMFQDLSGRYNKMEVM